MYLYRFENKDQQIMILDVGFRFWLHQIFKIVDPCFQINFKKK